MTVVVPVKWLIGGVAVLAAAAAAVLVLAWPGQDTTKIAPRLAAKQPAVDAKVVPAQPAQPSKPAEPQVQPLPGPITPPQQQTQPPPPPQPQQQALPAPQPPAPPLPNVTPSPNVVPTTLGPNHADELTDWGIQPQLVLQDDIGSPTPMSLPGGRRITTEELPNIAVKSMLIDVLDGRGHATIPGSIYMPGGGNYGRGRYNDGLQRNLSNTLARLTNRNPDYPLVFFCAGARCWESYNAALRAINMGYRNVMWYRGGLESWKAARFPVQPPVAVYRIRS